MFVQAQIINLTQVWYLHVYPQGVHYTIQQKILLSTLLVDPLQVLLESCHPQHHNSETGY